MTNYEKNKKTIDIWWKQNIHIGINKDTKEIFPCPELECEDEFKLKVYPIGKAIDNSKKYYVSNILPQIFDTINKEIQLRSEDGWYSATINYEYPSFYRDHRIEQIQEVVKRVYEQAGYIVDCGENPYEKNTLIFTITWKDEEDDND